MQQRIKQRVEAAVASATGDVSQLRACIKEIVEDEMHATHMPAAFVDAIVSLFDGTITVNEAVGLGMKGMFGK